MEKKKKKWRDIAGLDLEWFCSDVDEQVAVFFTAGPGLIPEMIIDELDFDEEFRSGMNERYHYERIGFWVYDWNDVHKIIFHCTYQYQRVGVPQKPLRINELPPRFQVTMRKRKIGSRFSDLTSIPIQNYFRCEKPAVEEKVEMIEQLRFRNGVPIALVVVFRQYDYLENICQNSDFTVLFSQAAEQGKIFTEKGTLNVSNYPNLRVTYVRDASHSLDLLGKLLDELYVHLSPFARSAEDASAIPPFSFGGMQIPFSPKGENRPFGLSLLGSPGWLNLEPDVEQC